MKDIRSMPIILASASPRRKELLEQIGLAPMVQPSDTEEIITEIEPEHVVMQLSKQKAMAIADHHKGQAVIVIGADTVVVVDGMILGKPIDEAAAVEMISLLQNRTHQVYTGVTLVNCRSGVTKSFVEQTDVTVFAMKQEEIRAYVATKDCLDKAGAYGIQGEFAAYIKAIAGDYNNVVGLPVGRVYQELKQIFNITEN